MDVVLTPVASQEGAWDLKDRLGRSLGNIRKESGYEITAEPTSKLKGVKVAHASLDDAMTAIAERMAGSCSIEGRD